MTTYFFSADEINAAIARGADVIARAADLPRKHQPRSGAEVTLVEAFDGGDCIRATARGYRGRFRVEVLGISDVNLD